MIEERYFTVPEAGRRTIASTADAGPPLVVVHGVTRRWQCFLPVIPALSIRWTVHGIDLRGHGTSERCSAGYRVIDYAQDVIALLREVVQPPAMLYGHSLGAMVVAAVAAEAPELTQGIIMEDPPFSAMGSEIEQTFLHGYFAGVHQIAQMPGSIQEVMQRLADLKVQNPVDDTEVRLGDVRDPTTLLFMARCLRQVDPQVLEPIVNSQWLDGYSLEEICSKITCPALLMQADWRLGGMLRDKDAELMESKLDLCCRVRLPDVGHLVHWMQPQTLLRHVMSFLEGVD